VSTYFNLSAALLTAAIWRPNVDSKAESCSWAYAAVFNGAITVLSISALYNLNFSKNKSNSLLIECRYSLLS
jgi:hypothetical protein